LDRREHRRLLANFAFKADMGFNAKADASGGDAGGQQFPLLHRQDHTKMGHGNVMSVHRIMRGNGSRIGIEMRDDLMSEKVEVDPVI
jgi:hypothetical protein